MQEDNPIIKLCECENYYHFKCMKAKIKEAGVTKKKRNYVMYESKLGTEKETDLTQIKAPPKPVKPKKLEPKPRVEEKVIMTRKKVEYMKVPKILHV